MQILNIYTFLLKKLSISLADFKEIHVYNKHFIKYYLAFLVYADTIEQNDEDDEVEQSSPYQSFLITYMAEFIALSKSNELLIKHHKKYDPKGYKQRIKKMEELLITSKIK